MAKVTSVVVSWTLDSLHRRGRPACAVYYSDKISESLSRVDSFKHESWCRCAEIQERETRCCLRRKRRVQAGKVLPDSCNFPLLLVFAKILADRLTTSLKSFRSKIIIHQSRYTPIPYSLDPIIISNKRKITKRKDV